jgi:hypothetical protein
MVPSYSPRDPLATLHQVLHQSSALELGEAAHAFGCGDTGCLQDLRAPDRTDAWHGTKDIYYPHPLVGLKSGLEHFFNGYSTFPQ